MKVKLQRLQKEMLFRVILIHSNFELHGSQLTDCCEVQVSLWFVLIQIIQNYMH